MQLERGVTPVVLITGAGGGVGRAVALRFARDGYAVGAAGRTFELVKSLAADIAAAGGRAVALACDVSVKDDVYRAAGEAERMLGPIDVLVNNAGIADSAPFVAMD